jgi:octaprenyl-diphosphate synthase
VINEIYAPIRVHIDQVEHGITTLAETSSFDAVRNILRYFLASPGKYLRPALIFLSARTTDTTLSADQEERIVDIALAIELIHSASLVHDDIIDHGMERRGRPTLNAAWGNTIAVLAGDSLYSHAFCILARVFPAEHLGRIARLLETMCQAEIEQERAVNNLSKEAYVAIVKGKTAGFMELCCFLGAYFAGGDETETKCLENFGLYFGIAYQLFDDYADGDSPCREIAGFAKAEKYADLAIASIKDLPQSVGREKLTELALHLVATNRKEASTGITTARP